MAEITKARRRWPWVVVATILIVVGGPVAWRYRPLSSEERSLLGTWQCKLARAPGTFTITFRENRRYLLVKGNNQNTEEGKWSISGERLTCSAEPPRVLWHLKDSLRGQSRRRRWLVDFETVDRMRVTEVADPMRVTFDTSRSEIYQRLPASEAEDFEYSPREGR